MDLACMCKNYTWINFGMWWDQENEVMQALPTLSWGLQNCHPFLLCQDCGSVASTCTDWFASTGIHLKQKSMYETVSMHMETITLYTMQFNKTISTISTRLKPCK